MSTAQLIQLAASLVAVLALGWLCRWMGLGGDVRIRDEAHARALASEAVYGFDASDVALDRAGIGALLKDRNGRQMLLRRNGAAFVGRLLDPKVEARLDQQFLTIGTGERLFGSVTLNLGDQAQYWASGLRHLKS
jgi:hypothetical protein